MRFSGERVRHFRESRDLSRPELAELTSGAVSKSTIKRLENDADTNVTLSTIEALATALAVPLEALFINGEPEEDAA